MRPAGDLPSTTATQAGSSADFSAETATAGSDSFVTDQTSSGQPRPTLTEPWLVWVDTDYEQDAMEAALTARFGPGMFCSTRGSHTIEQKEHAIATWLEGERPVLIGKPSMLGFGLNFQHCARMIFVGRSFSYESWYQAVRRCWRFGQTRPVQVHLIVAAGESAIGQVIDRKAADHATMKAAMAAAMREARREARVRVTYEPRHTGRMPRWLRSTAA